MVESVPRGTCVVVWLFCCFCCWKRGGKGEPSSGDNLLCWIVSVLSVTSALKVANRVTSCDECSCLGIVDFTSAKKKKKVRRNEVNSCVGTGPLVLDCVSSHNAGKLWPAGVVIAARRIHDYFASIVFWTLQVSTTFFPSFLFCCFFFLPCFSSMKSKNVLKIVTCQYCVHFYSFFYIHTLYTFRVF